MQYKLYWVGNKNCGFLMRLGDWGPAGMFELSLCVFSTAELAMGVERR